MGEPEIPVQELHLERLQEMNISKSSGACTCQVWQNRPRFFILTERNYKMSRFFDRCSPMAEIERQMTMVPNFAPRGYGSAVLCRYHPTAADVDCRNCLQHRRRSCRSLTCLYLSERLVAGAVTMEELIAETVRPWKHLPLKQRAMGAACQTAGSYFDGRLHIMRMQEMTKDGDRTVNSRWLAAVYLLSARAALWQKTISAVRPDRIDFSIVRLGNCTVQDYVLYRAAKGIFSGTLGATSEELADPELVNDDTLLLIVGAAVIARYGPEAMRIGRGSDD